MGAVVWVGLRGRSCPAATACYAAAVARGSLQIMDRAIQNPPPGFDDLTVHDQIEYVQTLWERIATREDQVPVPEWHKAELDRRLAEYEAAPDVGRSWEEVEADLLVRLATRR
jgi:putative addiction module component (TIGR02574 family)